MTNGRERMKIPCIRRWLQFLGRENSVVSVLFDAASQTKTRMVVVQGDSKYLSCTAEPAEKRNLGSVVVAV